MSAIPLHLAAFDGDNEAVNRLLTQGAIPDALTNDNETPLLFAAMNGHTATVRTLLKWGADVNRLPGTGNSILRRAIGGGHAEVVRLLLAQGADPNAEVAERTPTVEEKTEAREKMREMSEKLRQLTASLGVSDTPIPDMLNAATGDDSLLEKHKPIKQPGEYQCLMLAIRSRSYETLKTLLNAGYSPVPTSCTKNVPSILDFAKTLGGGVEMARLLLEHGASPNGDDTGGTSPLQTAVMMGDLPFVRLLIEFGARTDSQEPGMSLLTYAIMRENRELIEFLLNKNIGTEDDRAEFFATHQKRPDFAELIRRKRGTAWLSLVESGDLEGVRTALRNGADIHVAEERNGSCLMIAAKNADAAMVRLLLEEGADPNYGGQSNVTPLHTAATKGAIDVAKILIEKGANIHAETTIGQTPLYRAALSSHQDIADLLITNGARLSVVEAILLRRFEVADSFWASGTPITYSNEMGATALHAAVAIKDIALISSLLSRGAAVDVTDRSDHTPLLFAISSDDVDIARLLLDNGADPQGNGKPFYTPIHRAILQRSAPIARLLLERGASIEPPISKKPQTSIPVSTESIGNSIHIINIVLGTHRRILQGDEANTGADWQRLDRLWPIVRLLLEFGVDANTTDYEDNSLLFNLIEFDAPLDLIQYAIEKGAAVNATKPQQKVPLMLAIDKQRTDLVELLLTAGANPNGGRAKETPLQVATEKGLTEIITLLQKHGASDEKREATVADLGEMVQWLFRPSNESSTSPLANMHMPDFAQLGERMTERRDQRIVERRARLEAEIREAENQANEP